MNIPAPIYVICAAALAFAAGCAQYPTHRAPVAAPAPPPPPAATIKDPAPAYAVPRGYRVLGPLLGGVTAARSGYLLGAHRNHVTTTPPNHVAAQAAVDRALTTPATVADVHRTTTADLNHDGFVTVDEVVAMARAGLDELEVIRRMEATGHLFEFTEVERQQLLSQGVPTNVIRMMDDRLSVA